MSQLVHLLSCMELHVRVARDRCQKHLLGDRIYSDDHVYIAALEIETLLALPLVDACDINVERLFSYGHLVCDRSRGVCRTCIAAADGIQHRVGLAHKHRD